ITYRAPGALVWEATNNLTGLELRCSGRMESDGYINYRLTLKAGAATNLEDIYLEVPMNRQVAKYMMGLGHPAGFRLPQWDWHWSENANNVLWIGDVNAGLSLKLKNSDDRWDICWMPGAGYTNWANELRGGCKVSEVDSNTVLIRAFTGPRFVTQGEEL